MNFPTLAIVAFLGGGMERTIAAPDRPAETRVKAVEKSLAGLIDDLSDGQFRIREAASREIWAIGKRALPALEGIVGGKDPEQAYRARELIRKIQLYLTPDTDPVVISLVERYAKAESNDKIKWLYQLRERRAWRQILILYAGETNAQLRSRLVRAVEGVAVIAARECLVVGDKKGAREFLELAPADAAGLLALADFHRSQGTLEVELKRAASLKGVAADAWRLALHRAAGNLAAAQESATAAGESKLSASLAFLLGDPLPWLKLSKDDNQGDEVRQSYAELATKRWQGKDIRSADLELLVRLAQSKNRPDRGNAISALFLLGQTGPAEVAYAKSSPLGAFSYFDSLERIPQALSALGLDPENPDYPGWVAERIERLSKKDAEDEHEVSTDGPGLILLANFLERRGLHEQCLEAFEKPLIALAEKNKNIFTELLGDIFGNNPPKVGLDQSAPELAKRIAVAWAGDDGERWGMVIDAAFGGEDEIQAVWNWLAELDGKASRHERLDGMLALGGIGPDPDRLRRKWLTLAWDALRQTPVEKRKPIFGNIATLLSLSGDVTNDLKLWDQLAEGGGKGGGQAPIIDLSAAGRWDEAAAFFLGQIERMSEAGQPPQPYLHACAAASLRQAGRAADAVVQEALVETLALGNDAAQIASGYAYGYDFKRAAEWQARAARQCDPDADEWMSLLQRHGEDLLDQGNWLQAAAVNEVVAQAATATAFDDELPLSRLRLRLQSDLGRALARLKSDRAGSVEILRNCHRLFPSDGSLADNFFPAIRKMGLIQEHDAWFNQSWDQIAAVIGRFPKSENSYNTAAWLASRAHRNLDQAEILLQTALARNPDQSSYLDTMAEVQFARGNRKLALDWSTQAVNFMPLDVMLRRQQERFRHDPLPR